MSSSTLALVESSTPAESKQPPRPNKYVYPEFDGPHGEEYLNIVLQQVLPQALWRTWHWAVSFQAPGRLLYVGVSRIAEKMKPGERKVYLDLQELQGRGLLTITPTCMPVLGPDGNFVDRVLSVKDFSRLYDLAHEYHLWITSDEGQTLPPDRACVEIIRSNTQLMKKLIRFDNYRRLLLCKKPGRKALPKESHTWYSCQLEPDETSGGDSDGAKAGTKGISEADGPKLNLYSNECDNVSSLERISTESLNNTDSSDSELPSNGGGDDFTPADACSHEHGCSQEDYTKETKHEDISSSTLSPPLQTKPTNPSPHVLEETGPKQADRSKHPARREQADLDERAQTFVQRAMAAYETTQGETGRRGQNDAPKAKLNGLVGAFVREVSSVFHDQNVKGSLTRALRAVEHTPLSQKDILACLVKAYLVTQETKKVHERYRRPDGDIKMPLFCTMFVRFTSDCAAGRFGYTDEHLARDIAADDRLVLFLVEHKLEDLLLEGTVAIGVEREPEWQAAPVSEDNALSPENNVEQYPLTEDEMHTEAEHLEQPEEPQQDWISVADPEDGWPSWSSADHWAERLREHYPYGVNTYRYDVLPVCYDGEPTNQWAFVFYAHRDSQHRRWAVYVNSDQVKRHLDSTEKVWVAYDGVVGRTGAD